MIQNVKDMNPRPTCDRKDCPRLPSWQVGLKIWAKGFPRTPSTAIHCEIGLFLCDPCGRDTKPEDILNDASFELLERAARINGKAEPDRSSAKVELLPILRL